MSLLVSLFPQGKKAPSRIRTCASERYHSIRPVFHRNNFRGICRLRFRRTTLTVPTYPLWRLHPRGLLRKGSGRSYPCCHRFRLIVLAFNQPQGLHPTHDCRLSATDPRRLSGCHGLHALQPPFAAVSHGPGVDVSNRSLRSTFHRFRSMLLVLKGSCRIRTCLNAQASSHVLDESGCQYISNRPKTGPFCIYAVLDYYLQFRDACSYHAADPGPLCLGCLDHAPRVQDSIDLA